MSSRALAALDGILERGGDADDVLRATLDVLVVEPGLDWAGILFLEQGELILGPSVGSPDETQRTLTPISYQGDLVGELAVDGAAEPALLVRVAELLSAYVLLGWDTGGEAWEP